ncbi:KH domain-containing protein [Pyrobaculum calidifontis]|uniref:KH, type 1, domain protein n=1 Tax=Pyrobaculum calidifontis (strain DSM 21063 / JCM 11548 / VA1) TaxID=410359 RepID=A3MVD9_PYRCJ|nr:KH domain-containing protein [Pyrobaculum calidifontis]ABO08606.1 KH, type 1, domain protein [Pyrobaculum calidifontis JCM 11548]
MASEYLRGAIVEPIEAKRARAAREFVKLVDGKYGARAEFDEREMVIKITPGQGTGVDAVLKLREMARAVALGFTPQQALMLEDDEYVLAVVDLKEYTDKPNHLRRIKGRIIGEEGRAKHTIEQLAEVSMVVGDHYVAILGKLGDVEIAKRAVEMLIEGKKHSTVYKYIQEAKRG